MSAMLYLVPTPIGNLSDISERCREVLAQADFIAAEDTRVTLRLLNHLELKKPLVSYYEHNKAASGPRIVERILAGETCALVTDAGMPAISDPGEDIVRQCAEQGIDVQVIPGPCAAIAALAVSGLPTQQFCFEGFLAVSGKTRREHLQRLRGETRTMIFYEAPHKLLRTLSDLRDTFGGEREITLARELTKLHEQTLRTTLDGAVAHFTENAPKGEFVLVLRGAPERSEPEVTAEQALQIVARYRSEGRALKEACKLAAADTGAKQVCLAGGVAANGRLRQLVNDGAQKLGAKIFLPELKYCGDNGAMIAAQGYYEFQDGNVADWSLNGLPTLPIDYR